MILNELFNKIADWNFEIFSHHTLIAEFMVDKVKYVVSFEYRKGHNAWYFFFETTNYEMHATGTGNEFVVFATIIDILKTCIEKVNPETFIFYADDDEPSRVKLYDRFAKYIQKQGWDVERTSDGLGSTAYICTKEQQ